LHRYLAYGLTIQSELLLPELAVGAGSAEPDLVVRIGPAHADPEETEPGERARWGVAGEVVYALAGVGEFRVRSGEQIVVNPAPGVRESVLRLSLLGPVMSLLLHQRRYLVLHASIVARAEGAVGFLGGRGWGKSTIAVALCELGYRLVADDVTAVDTTRGVPMVVPGFPQIKLWPDALAALGEGPDAYPRVHPDFEKRAYRTRAFSHEPVPLSRLYVLAPGSAPAIAPLRPAEGFVEVVRHWYGARFGGLLPARDNASAALMMACAKLVSATEIRRLSRSRAGDALEAARLVDVDLGVVEHAYP
jgi:hypothetical protein